MKQRREGQREGQREGEKTEPGWEGERERSTIEGPLEGMQGLYLIIYHD